MFQSKQSKRKSRAVVADMLQGFMGVAEEKRVSSGNDAVKINSLALNAPLVKTNRGVAKRQRVKNRKAQNKRIVAKSRTERDLERISKLNQGDAETVKAVLDKKLAQLKAVDGLHDDDLVDLQAEVFALRKQSLNLDTVHEAALSNRERRERAMLADMHRDDAKVGVTPGLAMPGDSDDESESEADDDGPPAHDDALANFKDDFDNYN